MSLFNLFKSSKTVLVVDGISLNDALGLKGKVPPRTQLQVLRRLARFAQRENLGMVVVLTGSPLNKAPAGKKFEEIRVVYSKSLDAHTKFLVKTVRSKGSSAILVSGNAIAEKIAGRNVKTMRVSTFRKIFDFGGSDFAVNDRSERSGGEGNRNRNRNRPPRRQQKASSEKKQEHPSKENSDVDAINELIDLVD